MPEFAQIRSVEALAAFRANLIVFLSKARPALEEMSDEVRRTLVWLQTDRRSHWENEVRRRRQVWEEAQQQLFSAKLSTLCTPTAAQQLAANRAQRALHEAEEKLRLLRKWCRDFENLTEPLTKQIDQVHGLLTADMRHAVAYLAQVVTTLEAYADIAPASAPTTLLPTDGANVAADGEAILAAPTASPSPPTKPAGKPL